MPHLTKAKTGEKARKEARAPRPFAPGLPDSVASRTEKLEVVGSSFDDPGADWCEFRAYDADGRLITSRRVRGY
jgi:hypothetical protein